MVNKRTRAYLEGKYAVRFWVDCNGVWQCKAMTEEQYRRVYKR